MSTLETLKGSHADMLDLIRDLRAMMTKEQLSIRPNAMTTHRLICELAEKMKGHMSEQDKSVYPDLLIHRDPKLKSMAWGFLHSLCSYTLVILPPMAKVSVISSFSARGTERPPVAAALRTTSGTFSCRNESINRGEIAAPQGEFFVTSLTVRRTVLTSPRRPRGLSVSPFRVSVVPSALPVVTSKVSFACRDSTSPGARTL